MTSPRVRINDEVFDLVAAEISRLPAARDRVSMTVRMDAASVRRYARLTGLLAGNLRARTPVALLHPPWHLFGAVRALITSIGAPRRISTGAFVADLEMECRG